MKKLEDIYGRELRVGDPIISIYGNVLVDGIIEKINKSNFDVTYFYTWKNHRTGSIGTSEGWFRNTKESNRTVIKANNQHIQHMSTIFPRYKELIKQYNEG